MSVTSHLIEGPATDSPATSGSDAAVPPLKAPPFLHGREVSDALRVVNLVAAGRNPYADEPFGDLSPEHRDALLSALSVLVSALVYARPPAAASSRGEAVPAAAAAAAASGKRPLLAYLERVEREAILEALNQTNHNITAAARVLDITYRALRYRMQRLNLE